MKKRDLKKMSKKEVIKLYKKVEKDFNELDTDWSELLIESRVTQEELREAREEIKPLKKRLKKLEHLAETYEAVKLSQLKIDEAINILGARLPEAVRLEQS